MNIFVLDKDPTIAAQYHNDKHVVKMILETAQLLCTAHHVLSSDDKPDNLYKVTHKNHPSAVWVRESLANYIWLYNLFIELGKEYTFRYNKQHKTIQKLKDTLAIPPNNISFSGLTEFKLAMPNEFKLSDSVESYRNYYRNGKTHLAEWKIRGKPFWYN